MNWLRIAQGVLCAVEVCGLYYIFNLFYEQKRNKLWERIGFIITLILFCGLTIFHREVGGMYSRYFMFLCIFLAVCIGKFFYNITFTRCLLVSTLYFESIYFSDIFLGYIGQALLDSIDFVDYIQFHINLERIIILGITRCFLLIVLFILRKYKIHVNNLCFNYRMLLIGFAVLEYLGLFSCEKVFIPAYREEGKIYVYFALFPIILVLTFIIVIVYIMYIEKKNEMQLMNSQNEMLEKNYHEMLLLYQKRDRIFHDMKNHLSVLSLLIADRNLDRAEEYIKKVNAPILELEHKKYTGNRIVDIILNDKIEKAHNNNIKFIINAHDIKEGIIQDIDWCAILANVLDNAIEACIKVQNDEKWIEMSISQNDCSTIINVTNIYNGEIKISKDKLESTKKNKILHGIGMESVKTAVNKYNGIFEYNWEADIFYIYISLFN